MEDSEELEEMAAGATPKFRVDAAELAPPKPHAFDLPEPADIKRLAMWLDRDDLEISEFGEKMARYPGLSRYVAAEANFRAVHKEAIIRDPVHAAAFLGISGLQRVFTPLVAGAE